MTEQVERSMKSKKEKMNEAPKNKIKHTNPLKKPSSTNAGGRRRSIRKLKKIENAPKDHKIRGR